MKYLLLLATILEFRSIANCQHAPLPFDITGLQPVNSVLNLPVAQDGQRDAYLFMLRRRTKNRALLEYALMYSPTSFITGSWLDPSHPKEENYILHADMSPQFAIGGEWVATPILLTPRFKVRIFGEDTPAHDISLPVRTPSFMPGGTIFFPLQKLLTEESREIRFASLAVFHHSNGQDGPEFQMDTFNKYNGNFSNNYVEPALWYRVRVGGTPAAVPKFPGARNPYNDYFVKLGYEINFSTAVRLKPSYGTGHVTLYGGIVHVTHRRDIHPTTRLPFNSPYWREVYRALFQMSVVTGPRNRGLNTFAKRLNVEGSFHRRIKSSPNTALFAAVGYYGSDPYNIYYEDSYGYIRFGISAGLFFAPRPGHP